MLSASIDGVYTLFFENKNKRVTTGSTLMVLGATALFEIDVNPVKLFGGLAIVAGYCIATTAFGGEEGGGGGRGEDNPTPPTAPNDPSGLTADWIGRVENYAQTAYVTV